MVGNGRAHIAEVADMARANVADGVPCEALHCFASLGGGGLHASNTERDLHRWVGSLFGCGLQPYFTPMQLNVFWLYNINQINKIITDTRKLTFSGSRK